MILLQVTILELLNSFVVGADKFFAEQLQIGSIEIACERGMEGPVVSPIAPRCKSAEDPSTRTGVVAVGLDTFRIKPSQNRRVRGFHTVQHRYLVVLQISEGL